MNEQIHLIYPTIDLFLYDLRKGLGQNDAKIEQNRQEFWQKVYNNPQHNSSKKQLDTQLLAQLAAVEQESASFVQLLKSQQVEDFESPLDGYYYPLQLGDTYALHIDCSGRYTDSQHTPNAQPQPLSYLPEIKQQIISHIGGDRTTSKLGQTWMMSAQLPKDYTAKEIEEIAQKCYAKLAPDADWDSDLSGQGKILGATVFELWRLPKSIENWQDTNEHLLIWLFPPDQSLKSRDSISSIYVDLIRLFAYQNKTIWAYYQSQKAKTALETDYLSVKESVSAIAQMNHQTSTDKHGWQDLQKTLTKTLNILSHYAIDLSQLKAQVGTIRVNLKNYQDRLKRLEAKDEDKDKDLRFLREFSDFALEKYQAQVEGDYDNLSPGLTLLENLIKTIEGIIEIRKSESDRALNTTIALTGLGLATSQIAVSVIIAQQTPPKETPFFLTSAFGLSLATGAIPIAIAVIIWGIRRFSRR